MATRLSARGAALRLHVRSLAASRTYTVRRVAPDATPTPDLSFEVTPRELVDRFGIFPRDCRLLATASAHIAVRPDYFLVRFPPFTGAVRHDSALLVADRTDGQAVAAAEALQQRLAHAAVAGARPRR